MKKLSLFLILVLVITALASCSPDFNNLTETSGESGSADPSEPTTPAETTGSAPAETTGGTPSQDGGIVGKYCGSYTYDGNEFYVEIILNEDGTYKRDYKKNGAPYKSEEGDWELDESGRTPKVRLYVATDHSVWNAYEFHGTYLKEDSKVFNKQ